MPGSWSPLYLPSAEYSGEKTSEINIRLNFKHIDYYLSENDEVDSEYDLNIFAFDDASKTILSNIWTFSKLDKDSKRERVTLALRQSLYFRTTMLSPSMYFVFVLTSYNLVDANKKSEIGWCSVNIQEVLRSSSFHSCSANFLKGSCRLMYILSEVCNPSTLVADKHIIYYSGESNEELDNSRIPGINTDKELNKWSSGIFVKVYIEDISITTNSCQIADFENYLCSKVADDINNASNRVGALASVKLQVSERRIKIFLHNRYTVVQPVPVIYLDAIIDSERGSSSGRRKSTIMPVSSSKTLLVARNDSELFTPQDPQCAIVFILEYVLCEITSSTTPLKMNCSVRWATYPFEDNVEMFKNVGNHSTALNLPLHGSVEPVTNSNVSLSSLPNNNTNGIQIPTSDDFEKSLLKTVCPDGSFCFTENVNPMMELILNCTISTGIRKDTSENSAVEETVVLTKQLKGEFQTPMAKQQSSRRESNASLESKTNAAAIMPKQRIQQIRRRKSVLKSSTKVDLTSDIDQCEDLDEFNSKLLPVPIQAQFNLYTQLLQQQQRQQQMQLLNSYGGFLNHGTFVGPYLGGMGPTVYEPLEPTSLPLTAAFLNQKYNGSLLLLNNIYQGSGLSRAAYAKLYSAGFEPIQTENGDPPFTIDPQNDSISAFVLKKEELDPLNQNEIIFQFLAYSGFESSEALTTDVPEQIYFTFQFYRFPQVKTPTLFIQQSSEDSLNSDGTTFRIIWKTKLQAEKLSLGEIKSQSTLNKAESRTPGYKVIFLIDSTYFKPGETELFFNYLLRANMQIDVWNAKSHILIGTCIVELKHLCRQGREAVQVTYSTDILRFNNNDLFDDGEASSIHPPDNHGRLHLRLANVGHRKQSAGKEIIIRNNSSRKRFLINESDVGCFGKFKGGALSNINSFESKAFNENTTGLTVRAHKIRSTNSELQEMLRSITTSENTMPKTIRAMKSLNTEKHRKELPSEDEATRQTKLERLHCSLKAIHGLTGVYDEKLFPKAYSTHTLLPEKKLQLDTISHYREQKKRELIEQMITGATTIEHNLYTSFGCTEFFEYQLKNPYNVEDTICATIEDDTNNLSFVVNSSEVRALKLAFGIDTPTEDNLFAVDITDNFIDQNNQGDGQVAQKEKKKVTIRLFLKPNETVLLPIKYEECTMFPNAKQYAGVDERNLSEFTSNIEDEPKEMKRVAQIIFKSTTYGKIISQLILHIHIRPPIIDQSFRCFHPELSFLKKILRLPRSAIQWRGNISSAEQNTIQQINHQLWTRVSDPDVLTLSNVQGDTVDILIKVGLGKSPQVREFLISVYIEPFQIRPAYIWYWAVHSLQRVDAIATVGQLSAPLGLLLRTDDCSPNIGTKRISVYPSHPNEVIIGTELNSSSFQQNPIGKELTLSVSSRSVHELKVKLCPRSSGKKVYQINVVDIDSQRVIRAWILCVDAKQPEVTKSFNIKLPKRGVNESCNKRVSYTNPYKCNKTLVLETNRPDLLKFKESILDIPAGGTIPIGLRFIPKVTINSSEQIYIFIKDEQEKLLETFLVIAQYDDDD